MKKIRIGLILVLFTLSVGCNRDEPLRARITQIHGAVKVESGGIASTAAVGAILSAKDVILTEKDAFADLMFPGGSVLRVRSETRLVLGDPGKNVRLKLERGETLLGLAKQKQDESFTVETPTAVASVRGTSFSVSAEQRSVAVLTGSVQVERNGKSLVVESMKETRTDRSDLKTEGLSRESAEDLSELLQIEGAERLDDFDEMQKNWARFAAENQPDYLPMKKVELPSREAREK